MRGVYYTPEPVVSYIVRSIHSILKEKFNRADGFASNTVTVLDPAAGTLTFLAETAKLAVGEFVSKYGEGSKENFIKEHILRDFHAFELMMAPYAVGHLKMSFLLEELGYRLKKEDRVKLYLTNTLEMEELSQTELPGMASLSEESHLAGKVKKEQPILVILGNPPYSGHSSNIGDWISKEIRAYYQVDGKPLKEKNPKWLQDDYVKFIRFAQWKIDRMGEGVLGFITNHGYLDNPTFRGMRQSLKESFDEIYILDLHGNTLKKEKAPDGSKDENVFDIRQGVAIALFIKKKAMKKKISHAHLWGEREQKYSWLNKNNIGTTNWKQINPKSEFYLFIPRDEDLSLLYEKFIKITAIFPINSVGIVTSRDEFVIDFDKDKLKRRIGQYRDKNLDDEIIKEAFKLKDKIKLDKGKEKVEWSVKESRTQVIKDKDWELALIKIFYRPFDERWIFYHDSLVERSRKEIMSNFFKENFGLVLPRRVETNMPWSHILCTDKIVEHVAVSLKTIDYVFPLYLRIEANKPKLGRPFGTTFMLFEQAASYSARKPNISEAVLKLLVKTYGKQLSPEQIFKYIYAILYSNAYRKKFSEFLKIDFPRIPFTKDYRFFKKMAEYGSRLVDLHLLKYSALDFPIAKFQGEGENRVEKLKYEEKAGLLHINKTQYFEGISKEVWSYQIGGYQVCDKWLKDRKGRELSADEIRSYCRIVTSLKKTIEIQKAIDEIYPEVEKEIIEFP